MRSQIATKCTYCQQNISEYLDSTNPLLKGSYDEQAAYLKTKHTPFCSFRSLKDAEIFTIEKRQINQLKYYIHKYEIKDIYFDEIIRLIEDIFNNNNVRLYEKHTSAHGY